MADRIGQIKSLKKPQNIEHAPFFTPFLEDHKRENVHFAHLCLSVPFLKFFFKEGVNFVV